MKAVRRCTFVSKRRFRPMIKKELELMPQSFFIKNNIKIKNEFLKIFMFTILFICAYTIIVKLL